MQDALHLLSDLSEGDIDWIWDVSREEQVITGKRIIVEGSSPDCLYVVLEGLVGIRVSSMGEKVIARLGPGELLGEMSFLEKRPASATVVAAENSLLLAIPRSALEDKLESDTAFAARLYRSFALIADRRLRERVGELGRIIKGQATLDSTESTDRWRRIEQRLDQIKAALQNADHLAMANKNVVPSDVENQLIEGFLDFISWVNQELDAESDVHVVEDLGDRLQRELTPYVLLARTAERCYSKPRGYAGDYKTIEMIYQNKPGGTGRLGPLLDHCFLEMHAAYAVRNRRGVLAREIDATIDRSSDGPVNVTSMACGPAEEIFDVFKKSPDSENLKASLIDIDPEAIDFVTQRSVEAGLESQIDVHLANLVYLATGRATLGLAPQDLVYSIGLIDYFNDQFVINLMNYGYELLKPGGRMILGNFHPSNPTKAFMDWVTDWKLIHRTEEDMNRLYSASRFASPCSRILYEEQRINLFAECEKAEN